jgi:hypothetical protein
MGRNRELALFEDDFEMRRHVDVTLRLQQISTLLIGDGTNGALYEHVLGLLRVVGLDRPNVSGPRVRDLDPPNRDFFQSE